MVQYRPPLIVTFKKEGADLARRTRYKPGRLGEVLADVKRRFQGGPLSCLLSLIEPELLSAQAALRGGFLGQEDAERLALKVEEFMGHLPNEFGPRFLFDSGMIKAVCEEWSRQGTYLSDLIIPFPSDEWGHLSVAYARHGGSSVPVDLILFPGGRGLEGVDLLSYPFLCHELGHNVLFKHDHVFGPRFRPALDEYARSLQRRAIADRGAARQRAQSNVDEIAVCGGRPPTTTIGRTRSPWMSSPSGHAAPPIWPRSKMSSKRKASTPTRSARAIRPTKFARTPSCPRATSSVGRTLYRRDQAPDGRRRNSERRRGRTNSYLAYASPDLTRECVDAALSACEALGLPRCTPALVGEVSDRIQDGGMPDLGPNSSWPPGCVEIN